MHINNFVKITVAPVPSNPFKLTVSVDGGSVELPFVTLTGHQILDAARCHPVSDFVLLRHLPGNDLKVIKSDEIAERDEPEAHFYAIRAERLFHFILNDKKYPWGASIPEYILRMLGGMPANTQVWMRRRGAPDELIGHDCSVNLTDENIESFYTKQLGWKLDVQGVIIISTTPTITVRYALELAGINPDLPWTFILKVEGRPKEQVELNTVIDLTMQGIERLRVMPKIINNGEGPCLRRQFSLLEKDENFLSAAPYRWETAIDGERRWLLLHDFPLPAGYQQFYIVLAVEIPLLYPSAELDMFYCSPSVTLPAGAQIPKTETQQSIFGISFQRWSRHRENKVWSPTDDSVITHLGLIEESLRREVGQ